MAGKLRAAAVGEVSTQGRRGSAGIVVPLANTWLESRAGPLTGLSVAGLSCLGAPRSRGTARTARSSSSGGSRRTRAARGPEEGMAAWPVRGREVDNVCPKSPTPLGPGVWAPSVTPTPLLRVETQSVSFPGTQDSAPPALPSLDPGVLAPRTQPLHSDSGIRDLDPFAPEPKVQAPSHLLCQDLEVLVPSPSSPRPKDPDLWSPSPAPPLDPI